MAARPEIIPFQDFVNAHKEEFTPFELWLVDELTEHLVNKLDLDKSFTSIVVDTDEENPVGKVTGNEILIRLDGRFYLPTEDRTGKAIALSSEEWADTAKAWFDEVELEVSFDTESTNLLKFTVFVPALELPEGTAGGEAEEVAPEGEETPPEGEEVQPEAEETPEGGEATKTEETPPEGEEALKEEGTPEETEETEKPAEKPAEEEHDEELDEFTKALGL